jgi:hypothetical protein
VFGQVILPKVRVGLEIVNDHLYITNLLLESINDTLSDNANALEFDVVRGSTIVTGDDIVVRLGLSVFQVAKTHLVLSMNVVLL